MKISFKKMINGEFDTANLSCNSTNLSSSQCLVYCSLLSQDESCYKYFGENWKMHS